MKINVILLKKSVLKQTCLCVKYIQFYLRNSKYRNISVNKLGNTLWYHEIQREKNHKN